LITPMMPHVSAAFLAKVEAMVRAGGVWICAPVTGTRTAEHGLPLDGGLSAVEPLAGVEAEFSFPVTGTGATGEAFGVSAPLAGWCSALRARNSDTRVVGELNCAQAPGRALVTERKVGEGLVVVLGAQPQGEEGAKMLRAMVDHYAARAGVTRRHEVTRGTVVCPRVAEDGRELWIVVNMDGEGGEARLAGREVKVGRFEWRVVNR